MKFHECQHVLPTGNTCHAPRLRNQRFCYFHFAARDRVRRQRLAAERKLPLQIPALLESHVSVQYALSDVVNALLTDRIDNKKAALCLYALQTASANLKHIGSWAPENYDEYQPDLDPTLPDIGEEVVRTDVPEPVGCPTSGDVPDVGKTAPPLETISNQEETEPRRKPRRRNHSTIPPKKPVAKVKAPRKDVMGKLERILVNARKQELKTIRAYTKAIATGAAAPLPWVIKEDETAQEDYLDRERHILDAYRRAPGTRHVIADDDPRLKRPLKEKD